MLQEVLKETQSIARDAGKLALRGFYEEKNVDKKSSAVDWVTQFDKDTEKLIVERLRASYPDHAILGEEGGDYEGASEYRWYVDPIDGTNNYAHRFPIFCVSIALYKGEEPQVGVIYDPTRDEMFYAVKGEGAFLESPVGKTQLKVSDTEELVSSILATGFPYDRHTAERNNTQEVAAFVKTAQGVRRPGSAALDMVYVAAGRLDGYWEQRLFAWDMAAARVCLEEAGGKMTMFDGSPVRMETKFSVIVSNGKIHDQMLDVINSVK